MGNCEFEMLAEELGISSNDYSLEEMRKMAEIKDDI